MKRWLRKQRRSVTHHRPPGPKGLPIIGSLLQAQKDPLQFALNLTQTYGDLSYYRIGTFKGFFLNHPDYIRHVLKDHHRIYNKENYNYQMLKPVLGEGLLTSDGEKWLFERRMIQPIFHRKSIERFSSTTIEATEKMFEVWDSKAKKALPVNFSNDIMGLTLQVVSKALFNTDLEKDVENITKAFGPLNEDVSHRFKTIFVPPLWFPSPGNIRINSARSKLDDVVYNIISARRQQDGGGNDLLDLLLTARDESSGVQLNDQMLRDQVMTLMLAGHETTATLLAWTVFLLCLNQDAAGKLNDEIHKIVGNELPTVKDLPAFEYMDKVLQEAMRLYPPVWILSRKACAEDEIGGYI